MIDIPPYSEADSETPAQVDLGFVEACQNRSEKMLKGKRFLKDKSTIDTNGRLIWRADYLEKGNSNNEDVFIRVVCWYQEQDKEPTIIFKIFDKPESLD